MNIVIIETVVNEEHQRHCTLLADRQSAAHGHRNPAGNSRDMGKLGLIATYIANSECAA